MISVERGNCSRRISFLPVFILGWLLVAGSPPARAEVRYDIQGIWIGKYTCRPQGVTAGALSIVGTNPMQLTARFRYSPPPENPGAPSGEFELTGRYEPATGNISLRPTRWINQPPGYAMIAITGALAPDGQMQLRLIGGTCSSFTMALSNEKPSVPQAAAAPPPVAEPPNRPGSPRRRAPVVASIPSGDPVEGEWEGKARCGRTPNDFVLLVSSSPSGDFQAQLTKFGPNAILEPLRSSRFVGRFNEPDGTYQFVPQPGTGGESFIARISPAGDTLSAAFKDCEPLSARKPTPEALTRKPSIPIPQEGRYRREDPVPKRCEALIAWGQRLTDEYPALDMMKSAMSKIYTAAVFLFADDDFVSTFGITYEDAAGGEQRIILDDLRTNCRSDPFTRVKGGWLWSSPMFDKVFRGVQPGDFSVPAVVHATREIRRVRNEVISRQNVGSVGNFSDRAKDIVSTRGWLPGQTAFLWPSEVKRFDTLVSERKVILSKDIVAAWLAEMKALDDSEQNDGKISDGLRTNAQYVADLSAAEKAALNRELAIKLNALLTLQERDPSRLKPSPAFLADLKTLDTVVADRDEAAVRETRDRINRVLTVMLGKALPAIDSFEPTVDGLVAFARWQADIRNKFDPFPAYEPVKSAQAALTEKANALGPVVQAALRTDLSADLGVNDFVKTRGLLATIESSLKNRGVSDPLWVEYETAVTRWMQKEVDKAPRAVASSTAPGTRPAMASRDQSPLGDLGRLPGAPVQLAGDNSGFLAPGLSEPRIVSAIYRKDFGLIYKDDPARIGAYLIYLQNNLQTQCPGIVPLSVRRTIMREWSGLDLETVTNEDMTKLGLKVLERILNKLKDPAADIRNSAREEEIADKGSNDALRLAGSVSCSDPAWQGFFMNMGTYFRDRTEGMNPDDLTMADLCARQGSAKFCSCAGPVMETTLTEVQQKFVRINTKANITTARKLLPRADEALRKCG